jgi:predicted GNAT superfamily acetyltransferase
VDRIVVDARFRGQGIGAVLQDELAAEARTLGIARITCEVNLAPPNPGSLRFHQRLGFREVDQLRAGAKLVYLLEKVLSA